MKKALDEERIYFNLKLVHILNKVRVLLRDAACIKQHIENVESGNLNEIDLYNLCREERPECQK